MKTLTADEAVVDLGKWLERAGGHDPPRHNSRDRPLAEPLTRVPGSVLETTSEPRHVFAVTTIVQLDALNRIALPRDLRRAAGVPRGQKLRASAVPGRIVLEVEPATRGKVVKRGRWKLWTGAVPPAPLAEAVEAARRYER